MDAVCIRASADANQIKECKEEIRLIQKKSSSLSRMMALAGNEVRLHILYLLDREGQMCPCDLSDVLQLKVSPISQHLRKLKDSGMVMDKKEGQIIFYSLNHDVTGPLMPIIRSLKPTKELVHDL